MSLFLSTAFFATLGRRLAVIKKTYQEARSKVATNVARKGYRKGYFAILRSE